VQSCAEKERDPTLVAAARVMTCARVRELEGYTVRGTRSIGRRYPRIPPWIDTRSIDGDGWSQRER
jgi:hypothetical protein